jgi:hypothetical protein
MEFSDRFIYLVGLLTIVILCVFGVINAARFLLSSFYRNYHDIAIEVEALKPGSKTRLSDSSVQAAIKGDNP